MLEVLEEPVGEEADRLPGRDVLGAVQRRSSPSTSASPSTTTPGPAGLVIGQGRVAKGADRDPAALDAAGGVAGDDPLDRAGAIEPDTSGSARSPSRRCPSRAGPRASAPPRGRRSRRRGPRARPARQGSRPQLGDEVHHPRADLCVHRPGSRPDSASLGVDRLQLGQHDVGGEALDRAARPLPEPLAAARRRRAAGSPSRAAAPPSSLGCTSRPLTPSSTMSVRPPVAEAITGVPWPSPPGRRSGRDRARPRGRPGRGRRGTARRAPPRRRRPEVADCRARSASRRRRPASARGPATETAEGLQQAPGGPCAGAAGPTKRIEAGSSAGWVLRRGGLARPGGRSTKLGTTRSGRGSTPAPGDPVAETWLGDGEHQPHPPVQPGTVALQRKRQAGSLRQGEVVAAQAGGDRGRGRTRSRSASSDFFGQARP